MSKIHKIWIVMEPKNGDHNRITSTSHISESDAIRKAIRRWLPEDLFPSLPGDIYYDTVGELWGGMKKAGWELTVVEVES